MEGENTPKSLSAMVAKDQYEQFMRTMQAKHEELMQWMKASHEDFMQKMMHQTQNNIGIGTIWKEANKRDVNMTHDASANKGIGTPGMENPNNFHKEDGIVKAENDEEPSSGLLRSTSLFGAQTGSSSSTCASISVTSSPSVGASSAVPAIGFTSMPVWKFGQPSSSPFGSTSLSDTQPGISMCGGTASSSPALDATSMLAFGTPSMPAFCSTSNPLHGISTFGQKPSLGEFSSPSPAQLSPSRSIFGQTGPAFVSQPFGVISTSACGSTLTPAFGATTPIFGAMNALAYGAPSTPATGASRNSTIGIVSTPAVGQSNAAFGGASTPTFGSSPAFGSSASPFGSQASALGAQSKIPMFDSLGFGRTPFGRPRGSCRMASYTSTNETDNGFAGQAPGKFISISAMPQYKDESHEELRWGDYQLDNKGCSYPASQQFAGGNIYCQSAPLFGQPIPPLGKTTLGQKSSFGGFCSRSPTQSSPCRSTLGQTELSFGTQPFGAAILPAFGAASTSAFGFTSTPAFGTMTTPFRVTNVPAFGAPSTSPSETSSIPSFEFFSTPAFGLSATSFGATSATTFASSPSGSTYCQTEPAFSTQPLGAAIQPAFGATGIPAFGVTTTSFGATNVLTFSAPSTSASKASSIPSIGLYSMHALGSPATVFGATSAPTFGCNASPFGSQGSALRDQSTTSSFITEGFGRIPSGRLCGSGLTTYTTTNEADTPFGQTPGKLSSISAMPQLKDESHEELRWADYQFGNKGTCTFVQNQQPIRNNMFSALGQIPNSLDPMSAANPFSSSSFNVFGSSQPFGAISTSACGSTSTPPFGATAPIFGAMNAFACGAPSTPASGASWNPTIEIGSSPAVGQWKWNGTFGGTSPPIFGGSPAFGSTTWNPTNGIGSTPAVGQWKWNGTFGGTSPPIFGGSPAFGSTTWNPTNGIGSTPAVGQWNGTFGGASTPTFGGSPAFGSTTVPFGSQTSALGTSTFVQNQQPIRNHMFSAFGQIPNSFDPMSAVNPYFPFSNVCGSSTPFGNSQSWNGPIFLMCFWPIPIRIS